MPWVTRGLRNGVLTTPYPNRPDGYGDNWHGSVVVGPGVARHLGLCRLRQGAQPAPSPPGEAATSALDRGKCILCGRCVIEGPGTFSFAPSAEVARRSRAGLVVPPTEENEAAVAECARRPGPACPSLWAGRSMCVMWMQARTAPMSGRWLRCSAPSTTCTGSASFSLPAQDMPTCSWSRVLARPAWLRPLSVTYDAMPEPRVVVAVGTDAISGGLVSPSYASSGGVGDVVPVDVWVPGSPPSPFSILHGILLAIGRLPVGGPADEASPSPRGVGSVGRRGCHQPGLRRWPAVVAPGHLRCGGSGSALVTALGALMCHEPSPHGRASVTSWTSARHLSASTSWPGCSSLFRGASGWSSPWRWSAGRAPGAAPAGVPLRPVTCCS